MELHPQPLSARRSRMEWKLSPTFRIGISSPKCFVTVDRLTKNLNRGEWGSFVHILLFSVKILQNRAEKAPIFSSEIRTNKDEFGAISFRYQENSLDNRGLVGYNLTSLKI